MSRFTPSLPQPHPPSRFGRLFGNLKVRPKLIVLHNFFFLVLTGSVYFALILSIEQRMPASKARWILFLVLGAIYILSVLLLELVIMPTYVYYPLRRMLDADRAAQAGDRKGEIIDESEIPGDEIGQIMRSRNATMTQLRKHEDELEQALRQLEAQDRLASIGFLTASVAHELNTPLSVLHGSVEKLMETVKDQASRDRLARMLRVTERLKRISESLLDFSRLRRREMGPVPIRSLIEEAWGLVAIDEKAAQVSFLNSVPESAVARGNFDRLLQVFVNLIRNALHATQPGGTIAVTAHEGGPSLIVNVEDNGAGIPEDVLPQIFEAFVSQRLDSSGTGLGLTVAKGIVEQHGGSIHAENRPEGGARLQVRLPPHTI